MEQRINGLSLDLLSHPSDTIYELMVVMRLTPLMLAKSLRIEYKELDSFMRGKSLLSELYYPRLAKTFNVKESFIRNIFSSYKRNAELVLKGEGVFLFEYQLANKFELRKFRKYLDNYSYLNNLSCIDKIYWLRDYFKVKSLNVFETFVNKNFAFRSNKNDSDTTLDKLFLVSNLIKKESNPVKAKNVYRIDLFKTLKSITFEKELDDAIYQIKEVLRKYGINFIYYEYDEKIKVQGFLTRSQDVIYLGVSNKGKYHDIFWFTLCHELGHLLYGILTFDYAIFDDEEKMADSFAEKILIDQEKYEVFIDKGDFSSNAILSLSEELNIAPGIIVGRLQKDRYIRNDSLNYLRKKA